MGCTPVNKILFWAVYFLTGVDGNYLEYWKRIAPCGMNKYSVTLNRPFHSCEQPTLFVRCIDIWHEYTDPVTSVNTLFTKCVHIWLVYMYPEGINTQTHSLLWTPCSHSQSVFTLFWLACQDDLLALKVTNELHHISIKRGIQILRLNGFNPGCLRRRPFPEEVSQQFIFSCLHCGPLSHPFYTPPPTRLPLDPLAMSVFML